MLGLESYRLVADMNRLLALLFHQVHYVCLVRFFRYVVNLTRNFFRCVSKELNLKFVTNFRYEMYMAQGVLDEQFLQLQQLQDESSPNFVSEVVNIYFNESEKLLRNLRALL